MANAIFNSTISEIKMMETELLELTLNTDFGDHKVRQETIRRKLTTYRELLQRAKAYNDVLETQQDPIKELAVSLQDTAKGHLVKLEEDEAGTSSQ